MSPKTNLFRLGIAIALVAAFGMTCALSARGQSQLPETVSPEACTVSPLTDAELVEIVEAVPIEEDEGTEDFTESEGERADDATSAAIAEVIRMSIACTNGNDPMRSFALFTDRYLQERFGGDNGDDLGHLLAALTRTPDVAPEADRLTLDAIEDVTRLSDGRVTATVTTSNSEAEFVDVVLFVQIDGDWKIDAVALGEPRSHATPEA